MLRRCLVALSVVGLGACGGGGGGGQPSPTTATLTGQVAPSGSGLASTAQVQHAARLAATGPAAVDCCGGEAIVWFVAGTDPVRGVDEIDRATGANLRLAGLLTPTGPARVTGNTTSTAETLKLVEELRTLPVVAAVEAHVIRNAGQEVPVSLAPNCPVTVQHSWSFEMVRTEGAWRNTRGDGAIVVAVVDSGVGLSSAPHPDLAGQLLPGYDFVDGDSDASDAVDGGFHGTHVAGTIGAVANNALGVAGVAPGVRILPVRVLNAEGRGGAFAIAQAIRWAAGLDVPGAPLNPNPARVINLSLGSAASSQVEGDAIEAATAAGVLVVAAAGNSNTAVGFPAAFDDVLAVSAVGPSATITNYSNFGPEIELAAPGGDLESPDDMVWSTKYQESTAMAGYAPSPGTSMACPHVAAVAALVVSANPDLTAAQVRTVLHETALDLGAPGRDNLYGFGLVDAKAAVERALELAGTPPPAEPARLAARTPVLRLTTSNDATTLRLTNLGDGPITLQSVTPYSLDDGARVANPAWLQASIVHATVTDTQDGRIDVTADPALAGPGSHQAVLEVASTAGLISVPVFVVTESIPDLGTVTVVLTNADTGAVVASSTTNAAGGYDFEIADIPPGTYYLSALVDTNADGEATRPDEWLGAFPSLDREVLVLAAGDVREGLTIPVHQQGETIRSGTGGGAINGVVGVLVRNADTGLPLEGAQVSIGDAVAQQVTDARGLAFFPGMSGAQTVTAKATGFNATTFVAINAAEIGIDLSPTRTEEEDEIGVGVQVNGLFEGLTALVFVGFDIEGTVIGDDPVNPDAVTTVKVGGPAIVSTIVFDEFGDAVGVGYGFISEEVLAQDQAFIAIEVVAFPAGNPLSVDVTSADPAMDGFLVLPVVIGETVEQMLHLGLALDFSPGTLATPVVSSPELAAFPASVLVLGENSVDGSGSIALHNDTVGNLVGANLDVALVAPPTLAAPADSGSIGEGSSFTFGTPATTTFGTLELVRPSDGFTWTFNFGPGTTQVRIPVLSVLGAGSYQWQVVAARAPGVTYTTLADLPPDLQEGFAALEFMALSATRTVTVP